MKDFPIGLAGAVVLLAIFGTLHYLGIDSQWGPHSPNHKLERK